MSIKGLGRAISRGHCVSQQVAKGTRSQQRTIASSSILQRHGAVPAFKNISSPELSELFKELRELVILPLHLSKDQKSLIYKKKHQNTFYNTSVKARIAGEEFTLRSIDATKDCPPIRNNLFKAISLMSTKEEWENLPSLLTGLGQTPLNLKNDWSSIIRKVSQAGRQDVILQCARQAQLTKLPLNDTKVVQQILWWFQTKALDSDFKAEETKKALSWCEQIFILMDDPSKSRIDSNSVDPRIQPEVVGILLYLAAVRASKHLSGQDEDQKVEKYAEKLLGTSLDFELPNPENVHGRSQWLAKTAPVLRGIKVAASVLDPTSNILKELNTKIPQLESQVLQTYELASADVEKLDYIPSGLQIYQKLFAEKP